MELIFSYMPNKPLFLFKEQVYFTLMINTFMGSHIKPLQDITLVILLNKITILATHIPELFEGCLYEYRNTMVLTMFFVKLREDKYGDWSSHQTVSLLEIPQISLRNFVG